MKLKQGFLNRANLRMQHLVEKEKLVLSVEQEILRVHGRAERAVANQVIYKHNQPFFQIDKCYIYIYLYFHTNVVKLKNTFCYIKRQQLLGIVI